MTNQVLQKGDSKLYQRWIQAGKDVTALKRAVQYGTPLTTDSALLWVRFSNDVVNALQELRAETKLYLSKTLKNKEKVNVRRLPGASKKARR